MTETAYKQSGLLLANLLLWDGWQEDMHKYTDFTKALSERLDGRHIYEINSALSGREVLGVECRDHAERRVPPEGWKYNAKYGVLMPKVSTKIGHALALEFSEYKIKRPEFIGMPHTMLVGLSIQAPAMTEVDRVLYVRWEVDPEVIEKHKDFDDRYWARIKMSEYHAALETQEAAQATPA